MSSVPSESPAVSPSLAQLGALEQLLPDEETKDAALLLEIFRSIENWISREELMTKSANKLHTYAFAAVWSDKRSGPSVGWRLAWSGVPWSAAARALLDVNDKGKFVIRSTPGTPDPLSLEHVVPKSVIFADLRKMCLDGTTTADAVRYLHENVRLAVVTKAEGKGAAALGAVPSRLLPPSERKVMRRKALPPTEYLDAVTQAGLPWQWARYLEMSHDLASFATLREATDIRPDIRERLDAVL